MRADRIQTTFHYVPLHSSPAGVRFSARETSCHRSVDVSSRLLRLPFHNELSVADTDRVLESFVAAMRAVA